MWRYANFNPEKSTEIKREHSVRKRSQVALWLHLTSIRHLYSVTSLQLDDIQCAYTRCTGVYWFFLGNRFLLVWARTPKTIFQLKSFCFCYPLFCVRGLINSRRALLILWPFLRAHWQIIKKKKKHSIGFWPKVCREVNLGMVSNFGDGLVFGWSQM